MSYRITGWFKESLFARLVHIISERGARALPGRVIRTVTISAAVAKDKVIMWHVVEGRWNGQAAADMYAGPLKAALRRTWGNKKRFTIIEDGDRKGNQSNKNAKNSE